MLAITAAANGIGVGTAFILGKTNTVNATSTLTGKTQSPMLNVINSGSGTALNLHVSSGHPRSPSTLQPRSLTSTPVCWADASSPQPERPPCDRANRPGGQRQQHKQMRLRRGRLCGAVTTC